MTTKPCNAQLAYWLVKPLKDSWVNLNHLTTVRIVTGLAATVAIAVGDVSQSLMADCSIKKADDYYHLL